MFVGASVDGLREAVRPSDDEHEPPCRSLFLLQPSGQLYAARLLSALVQQYDGVLCLKLLQYQLAFGLLLLLLGVFMGKAMMNGMVPYRDLFDQKGILLLIGNVPISLPPIIGRIILSA